MHKLEVKNNTNCDKLSLYNYIQYEKVVLIVTYRQVGYILNFPIFSIAITRMINLF